MSVLELISRLELTCTRKLCFLVHGASPIPHLCVWPKTYFHPPPSLGSSLLFEIFRFDIVINCLIIYVLCCLIDSSFRLSHLSYLCQQLFSSFFVLFQKLLRFFRALKQNNTFFFVCQYSFFDFFSDFSTFIFYIFIFSKCCVLLVFFNKICPSFFDYNQQQEDWLP